MNTKVIHITNIAIKLPVLLEWEEWGIRDRRFEFKRKCCPFYNMT